MTLGSSLLGMILKNKVIRSVLTGFMWLCVIAGIGLRFTVLNMSFEYDELFTAVTTDPSIQLGWIWIHWLLPDVHPPLYNVLLWLYNHIVPYGPEVWLRLPSAVCGVLAIVAGWIMFPRYLGKTARLLFVGLLSCSEYMILYAQQARAYAWILLLAVVLTFWFLKLSRKIWHNKNIFLKEWLRFAALSLLLAWSHYLGTLLTGIFYILLFLQAWHYKRSLKMFIVVPAVVGILFLPWLIPNFLAQLQQERFDGYNWWANRDISWTSFHEFLLFFCFSLTGRCAAAVLGVGVVWKLIKRFKQKLPWRFSREILLLGAVLLIAVIFTSLISLKLFLFIGRYFTAMLPAVFLLFALLIGPLVRLNNFWRLAFCVLIASESITFAGQIKGFLHPSTMPARMVSMFYRDFFAGKEMMVIPVEAFPPQTMPAMYGFYVNKVFGLNVTVIDLVHLDQATRDAVLERHWGAFVFMPNCEEWKLEEISKAWHRKINVHGKLGTTCILSLSLTPTVSEDTPKKETGKKS